MIAPKHLEQDPTDLVRDMLGAFIGRMMGAEADAIAAPVTGERVNLERLPHRDFEGRSLGSRVF